MNDPNPLPPSITGRRRGTIARLPKSTRDQINNLMLDGFPYAKIIETLAATGLQLSEDSLSRWHLGGYQDWLKHQDWLEQMRHRHESFTDFIRENRSSKIHEATLSLLAANILELLNGFNPASLQRQLGENPAIFLRLLNSIARLARLGLQCEVRYEDAIERKAGQDRFQSALRDSGILR